MKKENLATLALLLATVFWGMTFAFIKDAVASLNVFNFLFWRFATASLIFMLFFRRLNLTNPTLIKQGVLLGIFLGATVIFQTIGLRYTTASTASFITGLSVVLVAIGTSWLDKQWPSSRVIIAIILTIAGIGLITLTAGLVINIGDWWVMLCAVCFAVYIILAGKYSHSGDSLTLTFLQMITICLLVGIISFFTNNFAIPNKTNLWISIIFCAIFASVIAFYLQIHFQRYVTTTKTAIIFAAEPIFATITAILYLGESLSLQFVIGALLIFAGMILSELKLKKKVLPQD